MGQVTPGSAATKRWKATPSGRAATSRYETSEKGRLRARAAKRAWKRRNIERARAHNRVLERVRVAVLTGRLVKGPCVECGNPIVHGHHPNGYDEAHVLDVVWLCPLHHTAAHGRQARAAA
jgi:hypothetical protein